MTSTAMEQHEQDQAMARAIPISGNGGIHNPVKHEGKPILHAQYAQ